MKANHSPLPKAPTVSFHPDHINLNGIVYTASILIENNWMVTSLDISTPALWLNHPKRKQCQQILSWPNFTLCHTLLDRYWEQQIHVDMLAPSAALRLAKLFIGEKTPYQLLLFATSNANSG